MEPFSLRVLLTKLNFFMTKRLTLHGLILMSFIVDFHEIQEFD